MFEDFQDIFVFSITLQEVVGNVAVALLCGIMISVLYRMTYRGLNYSASFVNSLVLLTMITSVVIMVIGNNLARAFGLVGAMSIIRFRTAVKDTQDIMFIFFALTIGLASGVGLYAVAIVGTIFIGSIAFVFSQVNYAKPKKKDFLLQISYAGSEKDDAPYMAALRKYCTDHKLINVKAIGEDSQEHVDLSFYVNLRREDASPRFIRELKTAEGVRKVNLFFDEE